MNRSYKTPWIKNLSYKISWIIRQAVVVKRVSLIKQGSHDTLCMYTDYTDYGGDSVHQKAICTISL